MTEKESKKIVLKLYITGETEKSEQAVENLKRIMEEKFDEKYDLKVVNILDQPQLAEDDKILATPTVIRKLPTPVKKIIGELSNKEKVLLGLDLKTPKQGDQNE